MPFEIQGIELLNIIEKFVVNSWIIPFVIMDLICLFSLIYFTLDTQPEAAIITFIIALICAMFTILISRNCIFKGENITRYQVSISDETPINEVTEHYDIVSIDGKIYTLEYKEPEGD